MILDFVHVTGNSEYLLRAYIDEAIENVHWGTTLSMVFLVSYGNFRMTLLMNEWTNMVMDDGWRSSIGQNPTFACQQLVMKYCHGWLKFGWKIYLVSDRNCNTVNL